MPKTFRLRGPLSSFTLIELLTVIAIIAILLGLTLAAASGVLKSAARSKARTDIQALTTALEGYKNDNGAYPIVPSGGFSSTNDYSQSPDSVGDYENSSAYLYQQLTGETNFGNHPPTAASGTKIYDTFTRAQLGNDDTGDEDVPIYLKDPFGNSYGYYSTTNGAPTTTLPNNGGGFFDLWSTGGDTTGATNSWIDNWGS
jgi:prepilin-type N-terminal cleavage/methylation domain-containing protein